MVGASGSEIRPERVGESLQINSGRFWEVLFSNERA